MSTDFQNFTLEFINCLTKKLRRYSFSTMYRMIKYSYIIFIAFLVQSCDNVIDGTDKEWLKFKCSDFKVGIEKMDLDIVKFEINKLVKDLKPKVTTRDKFGQKENINLLIERLSTLCNDINTELLCYACIRAWPK